MALAGSSVGTDVHEIVRRFYELKGVTPMNTSTAQKHAAKFLEWCKAHDVKPLPFMEARFTRFAKKGTPLGLRSMGSLTALKRWREWEQGVFSQEKHFSSAKPIEQSQREKRVLTLLREPTAVQENLRRTHQLEGRTQVCMADMEITGGYDPRSRLCLTCPSKHACLHALNRAEGFDVGALRVHLLSRLPADVADIARKFLTRG